MTRIRPSLHPHLLTRSDLARLQVPSGEIVSWLADGAIEQIGELVGADGSDSVFAIPPSKLRSELAARLATIGKSSVVLTPLGVRSFLLRTMLGQTDEQVRATNPDAAVAEFANDLTGVLDDAARQAEADVAVMLALAEEEARLEEPGNEPTNPRRPNMPADDFAAESEVAAERDAVGSEPAELDEAPDATDLEVNECFDFEDLTRQFAKPETTSAIHSAEEPAGTAHAAASNDADDRDEPLRDEPLQNSNQPEPELDMTNNEPTEPAAAPTDPGLTQAVAGGTAASIAQPVARPQPVARASAAPDSPLPPASTSSASVSDPSAESPPLPKPEPAAPEAPARTESATSAGQKDSSAPRGEERAAVLAGSMERVDSFLTQLKGALVELAQRPVVPAVDVAPVVAVVQAGFDRSAKLAAATSTALVSLGAQVQGLGASVEQSVERVAASVLAQPATAEGERRAPGYLIAQSSRMPVVLLALAALVIAWSILFWVKTGSSRLAIGTLVGANLIGCCLLACGRSR